MKTVVEKRNKIIKTNKLIWIGLLILPLLTSCAQVSDVSTNLDKENFKQYFSPSKVKIVDDESHFEGKYKMVGLVEGEDCQVKPHHAAPDLIEARTMARGKAYDLGANAIVFSGCTTVKTDRCLANLICYGKAYQVIPNND